MQWIHLVSRERRDEANMPQKLGNTFGQLGPKEWASHGWRRIAAEDQPPTGYEMTAFAIDSDVNGIDCRIRITATRSIAERVAAEEAAAAAAAEAAKADKIANFKASEVELREFAVRLRNYGIPAELQVTSEQATAIWRDIVEGK